MAKKMNKLEVFDKEFDLIVNPQIRNFAEKSVNVLPDYFFRIPASSTGKYHPVFSLGDGGLVRHVRAAIRIAVELFRADEMFQFTSDERDLIIVALLLHDGAKSGIPQTNFSVADHPLVVARYIRNNMDLQDIISEEYLSLMLSAIETHMSQWNKDYKSGKEILPKPENKFQKFVALCDYLASRKCLIMDFDVHVERQI